MSVDQTVDKLVVLFILDKMEIPLNEDTLVEMVSAQEWIPYMDCKLAFTALLETDFIYNVSKNNTPLYTITADGRACLQHFFAKIPSSLRDIITAHIKENRVYYRKSQEYFSDYYKNADGTYTVVLKILSPAQPVLDMKLCVPSRHTAKWIYRCWKDKAPQVYESIYDLLIE
ncbi:MAG: DUF4364 family protein [Clostridia bacterium]